MKPGKKYILLDLDDLNYKIKDIHEQADKITNVFTFLEDYKVLSTRLKVYEDLLENKVIDITALGLTCYLQGLEDGHNSESTINTINDIVDNFFEQTN